MSGLGACLIQEEHSVAYASRAVMLTETNYAQIEKELLAVVFGVEQFEGYMYMAERSLLTLIECCCVYRNLTQTFPTERVQRCTWLIHLANLTFF